MSISAPRSRFETTRNSLIRDLGAATKALSERLDALGLAESSLDFVAPEVV